MGACTPFAAENAADAAIDATVTDGATDGGVDGSAPVGCGWKGFDDDFEREPGALDKGWNGRTNGSTTSKITIEDTFGYGGSAKSMRAVVDEGGMPGGVFLRHSLVLEASTPPSCIAVAFALRVKDFPSTEGILALTIEFDADTIIGVSIENGQIAIAEQEFYDAGGSSYKTMLENPFPADTWVPVVLRYEGSPMRKVVLTVGGTTVQQAKPGFPHRRPTEVRAGVVHGKPYAARYFIDNIQVR